MTTIQRLGQLAEAFGPYLLVEVLLPGGSLIALGMWLYRRYGSATPLPRIASEIRGPARETAG